MRRRNSFAVRWIVSPSNSLDYLLEAITWDWDFGGLSSLVWKLGCRHGRVGSSHWGRIALINAVISNIPIYYLSLFKALAKIVHELTCIQRNFLWNGSAEKWGISWIKWIDVCRPKAEGGLGIKDIASFNSELLCKWILRCLVEVDSSWYKLVQRCYGNIIRRLVFDEVNRKSVKESLWRWDLLKLNVSKDFLVGEGFENLLSWKLGNGACIPFWFSRWLGNKPLHIEFPLVFSAVTNKSSAEWMRIMGWYTLGLGY